MKFTVDTKNKIISVEHSVNLDELVKELESLFPNGAWKEYTLNPNILSNPTYVPYYPISYPVNPHYSPTLPTTWPTTCGTGHVTDTNLSFTTTQNTASASVGSFPDSTLTLSDNPKPKSFLAISGSFPDRVN